MDALDASVLVVEDVHWTDEGTLEERQRLHIAEQVDCQQVRADFRGEVPELPAAGDQDETAGSTRKQRVHLVCIASVVQHHEHPPLRHRCPVQLPLALGFGWYAVCGDGDCVQEAADRIIGMRRRIRRVESA